MPCEQHTAVVYDRGGLTRYLTLAPLESVEWGRISGAISSCTITVRGSDCEADLSKIRAGRHELVIYRGSERVWEGPIVSPVSEAETVTIEAQDVLRYTEGTVMRAAYNNSGPVGSATAAIKSIDRAKNIITAEMNRSWETLDPPANVVPHLQPIYSDDDFKTTTSTTRYQRTVYDDIEALASRSGLEFTALGRSILLFDTDLGLSRTPVLTEADIAGSPQMIEFGDQVLAWAVAVASGEDDSVVAGAANGKNGFPDPYYGSWEGIVESSAEEDGTDTEATKGELRTLARKYLKGRIPAPVELSVPDGVTLAASSPLFNPSLLVPGTLVPVRATFLTGQMVRMQKLTEVKWGETASGETCAITLVSTEATMREA